VAVPHRAQHLFGCAAPPRPLADDAQLNGSRIGRDSSDHSADLATVERDPEYRYEIAQHVALCFSCVGRSLPPEQQAAAVLREVFELSAREASAVLDVTGSVLRHHLSAGRGAVQETFEGMCTLIGKTGVCYRCKSFRDRAPAERRGPELTAIAPTDAAARAQFAKRAALARGTARRLHDLLFQELAAWEAVRRDETTQPTPRRGN